MVIINASKVRLALLLAAVVLYSFLVSGVVVSIMLRDRNFRVLNPICSCVSLTSFVVAVMPRLLC